MSRECPFLKENPNLSYPPCCYQQHPNDENVMFCRVCQNWYKLDEVGPQFPNILFVMMGIILVILGINIMAEQPGSSIQSPPKFFELHHSD